MFSVNMHVAAIHAVPQAFIDIKLSFADKIYCEYLIKTLFHFKPSSKHAAF